MVPIGTDGMRLRNKNKLDCSCHQALPIEPLSDPDLVYFVLFVFFVVKYIKLLNILIPFIFIIISYQIPF